MKDLILHNLGLKIASLAIAVILWLVVVNVSDPVVDTSFSDIPLTVINADTLTAEGKVYEMPGSSTVAVNVSAKRSIIDSLGQDNFTAFVDLARYNEETGTVPVRVDSNRYSDKIESVKSKTESVEVIVEDGLRKQFVITPEVSGVPAEGYIIGDVTTAENVVRISGRESVVDSIAKVTAEVSVEGLGSDVNTSVDLKLYDEKGEQIKNSNLVRNITTVPISVEILPVKELEVRYGYTGKPAEGYTVSGEITGDIDTIEVAGRSSELARLSYLDIGGSYIDVTGLEESTSLTVDLDKVLPDGIVPVDREMTQIKVNIPIEEVATKEITIPRTSLKIANPGPGLRTEMISSSSVTFSITGVASVINDVKASDFKAEADWDAYMDEHDLAEITEGSYRLPLEITMPEGVSLVKDVTVSVRVESTVD